MENLLQAYSTSSSRVKLFLTFTSNCMYNNGVATHAVRSVFGGTDLLLVDINHKNKTLTLKNYNTNQFKIIVAMALTIGLSFIDLISIPLALPQIQSHLNANMRSEQWIINAYLLSLSIVMLLTGYLSDIFGHKRIFTSGSVLFFLASVVNVYASSASMLILGRSLQGIGSALMIPNVAVIMFNQFKSSQVAKAIGCQYTLSSIFLALAPLIAGFSILIGTWRLVFWLNIVLIIFIMYLMRSYTNKTDTPIQNITVDWLGFITISCTTLCFVFVCMQLQVLSKILCTLLTILTAIGIVLCVYVEKKALNPIINFKLFKNKLFTLGILSSFFTQASLVSIVFRTVWLQTTLGYTPFETGVLTLPATLPAVCMFFLTGRLCNTKRFSIAILLGFLISTLGMISIAIAVPLKEYHDLLPGYLLWGIGMPMATMALFTKIMSITPNKYRNAAASILNTSRQLGSVVGFSFLCMIEYFLKYTLKRSDSYALMVICLIVASFLTLVFILSLKMSYLERKKSHLLVSSNENF